MTKPGASSRRRADPRIACPGCGRGIAPDPDGTRRAHRQRDDSVSPYCEQGRRRTG